MLVVFQEHERKPGAPFPFNIRGPLRIGKVTTRPPVHAAAKELEDLDLSDLAIQDLHHEGGCNEREVDLNPWTTHNCIEGSMRDPFPIRTQNAIPIKLSIMPVLKRHTIATHYPSSVLTEPSNVT